MFVHIDIDKEEIKIANLDGTKETKHELGSLDDLSFLLDEILHTY